MIATNPEVTDILMSNGTINLTQSPEAVQILARPPNILVTTANMQKIMKAEAFLRRFVALKMGQNAFAAGTPLLTPLEAHDAPSDPLVG